MENEMKKWPCVRCTEQEYNDLIREELLTLGYLPISCTDFEHYPYLQTGCEYGTISNIDKKAVCTFNGLSEHQYLCSDISTFLHDCREVAIREGWYKEECLTLEEYQRRAMTTCTATSNNYHYMMGNLVGEVGEFNSKVAKMIRKDQGYFEGGKFCIETDTEEQERLLKMELGDILWQLSGVASVQGWSLEEIAQMNLDKLASRKDRGTIVGDGDER